MSSGGSSGPSAEPAVSRPPQAILITPCTVPTVPLDQLGIVPKPINPADPASDSRGDHPAQTDHISSAEPSPLCSLLTQTEPTDKSEMGACTSLTAKLGGQTDPPPVPPPIPPRPFPLLRPPDLDIFALNHRSHSAPSAAFASAAADSEAAAKPEAPVVRSGAAADSEAHPDVVIAMDAAQPEAPAIRYAVAAAAASASAAAGVDAAQRAVADEGLEPTLAPLAPTQGPPAAPLPAAESRHSNASALDAEAEAATHVAAARAHLLAAESGDADTPSASRSPQNSRQVAAHLAAAQAHLAVAVAAELRATGTPMTLQTAEATAVSATTPADRSPVAPAVAPVIATTAAATVPAGDDRDGSVGSVETAAVAVAAATGRKSLETHSKLENSAWVEAGKGESLTGLDVQFTDTDTPDSFLSNQISWIPETRVSPLQFVVDSALWPNSSCSAAFVAQAPPSASATASSSSSESSSSESSSSSSSPVPDALAKIVGHTFACPLGKDSKDDLVAQIQSRGCSDGVGLAWFAAGLSQEQLAAALAAVSPDLVLGAVLVLEPIAADTPHTPVLLDYLRAANRFGVTFEWIGRQDNQVAIRCTALPSSDN
jgi:hypothetical protein